jgi:hypothetical protein
MPNCKEYWEYFKLICSKGLFQAREVWGNFLITLFIFLVDMVIRTCDALSQVVNTNNNFLETFWKISQHDFFLFFIVFLVLVFLRGPYLIHIEHKRKNENLLQELEKYKGIGFFDDLSKSKFDHILHYISLAADWAEIKSKPREYDEDFIDCRDFIHFEREVGAGINEAYPSELAFEILKEIHESLMNELKKQTINTMEQHNYILKVFENTSNYLRDLKKTKINGDKIKNNFDPRYLKQYMNFSRHGEMDTKKEKTIVDWIVEQ